MQAHTPELRGFPGMVCCRFLDGAFTVAKLVLRAKRVLDKTKTHHAQHKHYIRWQSGTLIRLYEISSAYLFFSVH